MEILGQCLGVILSPLNRRFVARLCWFYVFLLFSSAVKTFQFIKNWENERPKRTITKVRYHRSTYGLHRNRKDVGSIPMGRQILARFFPHCSQLGLTIVYTLYSKITYQFILLILSRRENAHNSKKFTQPHNPYYPLTADVYKNSRPISQQLLRSLVNRALHTIYIKPKSTKVSRKDYRSKNKYTVTTINTNGTFSKR